MKINYQEINIKFINLSYIKKVSTTTNKIFVLSENKNKKNNRYRTNIKFKYLLRNTNIF